MQKHLPVVTSEEDESVVDHPRILQSLQNLPHSAIKLHQSVTERPTRRLPCIVSACILRVVCVLETESRQKVIKYIL